MRDHGEVVEAAEILGRAHGEELVLSVYTPSGDVKVATER
jgi:hypothetical protein